MGEYKGTFKPVPYVEDGMSAVLVSYGYGAGWSTWNCKELAYDSRIVEWLMENALFKDLTAEHGSQMKIEYVDVMKFQKYLFALGYREIYDGGIDGLTIDWFLEGTAIQITEYDGYESVTEISKIDYIQL